MDRLCCPCGAWVGIPPVVAGETFDPEEYQEFVRLHRDHPGLQESFTIQKGPRIYDSAPPPREKGVSSGFRSEVLDPWHR